MQTLRDKFYEKELAKGGNAGFECLRGLSEKQRDMLTKTEEELYKSLNPSANMQKHSSGREQKQKQAVKMPELSNNAQRQSQAAHHKSSQQAAKVSSKSTFSSHHERPLPDASGSSSSSQESKAKGHNPWNPYHSHRSHHPHRPLT